MKIIIYVNFSSSEFNKDFEISNALIDHGHTVLLVSNDIQLESAYKSYDIVLYGNSFSEMNDFDKIKSLNIKGLVIHDVLNLLN